MTNHPDIRKMSLPPVLKNFCVFSAILTFIAVCAVVCGRLLHLGYPYADYFLPGVTNFVDLWCFAQQFAHLHTDQFFLTPDVTHYNYPAAAAPLYAFFYLFPRPVPVFLGISVLFLLTLDVLLVRKLLARGMSTASAVTFIALSNALSYPLAFELNHANMEIFVWLLTGAGIYAFLKDRFWLAAFLIGIAGSIKLLPFLFLVLLFERRKYREIGFSFVIAGTVTVASMWLIDPHMLFTYRQIQAGLNSYQTDIVHRYYPILSGYDHSLFGLIKQIFHNLSTAQYAHIATVYTAVIGVLSLLLYVTRMRHLPFINRLLCLTVACLVLPPTSYDYRLIHLYTPWALLVLLAVDSYRSGRRHVPGLKQVFLCFIVLLSQVGEIIYHTVRVGSQIKAIALLYLLYLGLRYPFRSSLDDGGSHDTELLPAQAK